MEQGSATRTAAEYVAQPVDAVRPAVCTTDEEQGRRFNPQVMTSSAHGHIEGGGEETATGDPGDTFTLRAFDPCSVVESEQ